METKKSKIVGRKELLEQFSGLNEQLWEQADHLFPVRITRSWLSRLKRIDDALGVQVFPHSMELVSDPKDLLDPVGEEKLSPVPWVIQKHPDRVLLITTRRCHLYCRYCFRRNHEGAEDPSHIEMQHALRYINNSGAKEVILSGGDPLAIPLKRLRWILNTIQIPTIRIHTRAPITEPSVVKNALIEELRGRTGIWLIVHCNHPKELSKDVRVALSKIRKIGIPILNQAVLLRGVNDSVPVLEELCTLLVQEQVFPYYLHHTDAAAGNTAFRVDIKRGLALYRALSKRISGLALPKYVIDPPDGSGKIEVEIYLRKQHGETSRDAKI